MHRNFYVPKYRDKLVRFLVNYITPEVLRKLVMKDLIMRYYAIQYRLQKCVSNKKRNTTKRKKA